MGIYWTIFIISLLVQFIPIKNNRQYFWRTILAFLPLYVYGALRVNFGNDYDSYEDLYSLVHSTSDIFSIPHYEIGYILLNKIMPSFRSLLVFTTLITIGSYVFLFYKYIPPKYSWLAIVLLFFMGKHTIFFMFAGRNGLALAIAIFAIPYLLRRRYILYFIMSLLAMSIHTSAIAYMVILYIGTIGAVYRKTIYLYFSILFFLLIVSLNNLVFWLEPLLYYLSFDRYEVYYEIAKEYSDKGGGIITVIFACFFVIVILSAWRSTFNSNRVVKGSFLSYKSTLTKCVILYSFALCLGSLNYRMSQFFSPFFIAGVVIFVNECKLKPQKFLLPISAVIYVILTYWFLYKESLYRVYGTYQSIIGFINI